jgi:hypothetical protein
MGHRTARRKQPGPSAWCFMSIDLKTRERLLVNRRRRSLALYNAKQAGDKTGCLVLVWSLSLTLRIVFIAAPHGPCQVYLLTKQALLTCLVPFLCLVTASRNITTVRKWTLLSRIAPHRRLLLIYLYKHILSIDPARS